MFVWLFHRISGVLLVVLLGAQLVTGFYQSSSSSTELTKSMASLHKHAGLSCLLVFVATFHALYGLRTILLDFGVRRERLVFWVCTAVGAILFVTFLVLYLAFVVR